MAPHGQFELRHLQFARIDSTIATVDYIRESVSSASPFHDHTIANRQKIVVRKLEREEAAMRRLIRLIALRVPKSRLIAYCGKLILTKMDFLFWG